MSPPSTGPRTGANVSGRTVTPKTRPSRFGPAARTTIDWPIGWISPPPIPWRTRNAIRLPADQASPHSADPAVNSATDVIHIVRAPNRSLAQPASELWVDTQLGAPGSTSDRLVVAGNVNGLTYVKVNDVDAGPGAYNPLGITVVKVEGTVATGSSSTAFNVDPASPGFVGPDQVFTLGAIQKGAYIYPLIYNTYNDPTYQFFGLPGPFLAQATVFPTAAQNIFTETASSWYDRQEETRGCMRDGLDADSANANMPAKAGQQPESQCHSGVWAKLVGSWSNRNASLDLGQLGPLFNGIRYDTSYRQGTGGVIGGLDFGQSDLTSKYDSLVVTLMGGYLNSIVNFNSANAFATTGPLAPSNTALTFTGGTVGASATYMNRGFFVDALIKADFLNLNVGNMPGSFCSTSQPTLCSQAIHSLTWGVIGNLGYRFELGRYFFEPLGSVEWARNKIGDLNLPTQQTTIQFPNNDQVNAGGGARIGGVILDDRIRYLEASFIGRYWDHVSANNAVNYYNLGPTFTLTDTYTRGYGEAGIQLDWLNRFSGWSTYMRADAKFNNQFQTITGNVGLRYAF